MYMHICISLYITQPTEMFLALVLGSITTISCSLSFKILFGMRKHCKKIKPQQSKAL